MSGHVYLVGMPGAGKTDVGSALAQRLDLPYVDLDTEIALETGRNIEEIFAREGEAGFRERERHALVRASEGAPSVIACGGGAVLDAENRATLHTTGTVVFLEVPLDELAERLEGATETRPLLDEPSALQRLAEEREPLYEEIADVVVDGTGSIALVAGRVQEAIR